jgi:hypothetical protein
MIQTPAACSVKLLMTAIISISYQKLVSLLLSVTLIDLHKHTSLLYYGINYSSKKSYDTDLCSMFSQTSYDRN